MIGYHWVQYPWLPNVREDGASLILQPLPQFLICSVLSCLKVWHNKVRKASFTFELVSSMWHSSLGYLTIKQNPHFSYLTALRKYIHIFVFLIVLVHWNNMHCSSRNTRPCLSYIVNACIMAAHKLGVKCGMKLLIHSQTSTTQPLKFGAG